MEHKCSDFNNIERNQLDVKLALSALNESNKHAASLRGVRLILSQYILVVDK